MPSIRPQTQHQTFMLFYPKHKSYLATIIMSTSMSWEERFDTLMRQNELLFKKIHEDDQSVNKGSPFPTPKPMGPIPPIPQKNQTPQQSLPLQPRPKPLLKGIQRCFKCQGLGHIALNCPNREIISLAEWEVAKEEENEEEKKAYLIKDQEDNLSLIHI